MGIIEIVEESEWIIPMVVQDNKNVGEVCISIDLRKINNAFLHDPFLTLFIDELLESIRGQEIYSFTYGFYGYHHIEIEKEYLHNTTFVMEWVCFQYRLMHFGLKNTLDFFSRIVVTAFKDFILKFLEFYLTTRQCLGL